MAPPLTTHPDAFPASPPFDLDDADVIAAHDWAAFEDVSEMRDHWQRPGWSPGTRAYYWLLSITDPAFTDQAALCQEAVNGLGAFDLIGPGDFHATLGRVGLVDDIHDDQLDRLVRLVRDDPPHAFPLAAMPLTGSRGALRYSVAPWTPVVDLHRRLVAASAAVGLPAMKPSSRLRPHIGIGYCHQLLPAGPVRDAVGPLRALPAIRLLVDRVDLVELRREPAAYKWRVIHTVQLPISGASAN
ncbi:2'-5' RNA ligase family protein [Streptomyces sp. NPDC002817]|uniref:2'-5' RNA ligase family protein n=1 Tax=Streptomyces sp. NPDC088357 TaxID=3154655 RepID=UPI0034418C39